MLGFISRCGDGAAVAVTLLGVAIAASAATPAHAAFGTAPMEPVAGTCLSCSCPGEQKLCPTLGFPHCSSCRCTLNECDQA